MILMLDEAQIGRTFVNYVPVHVMHVKPILEPSL